MWKNDQKGSTYDRIFGATTKNEKQNKKSIQDDDDVSDSNLKNFDW